MTIREFQLERYFARWEFTAPYLLSASDCETVSVGELLDLAGVPLSALGNLRLGYTESQGDPGLRATIACFHSHITAEDVVVTNAPEEAIFLVMMAFLFDFGDSHIRLGLGRRNFRDGLVALDAHLAGAR